MGHREPCSHTINITTGRSGPPRFPAKFTAKLVNTTGVLRAGLVPARAETHVLGNWQVYVVHTLSLRRKHRPKPLLRSFAACAPLLRSFAAWSLLPCGPLLWGSLCCGPVQRGPFTCCALLSAAALRRPISSATLCCRPLCCAALCCSPLLPATAQLRLRVDSGLQQPAQGVAVRPSSMHNGKEQQRHVVVQRLTEGLAIAGQRDVAALAAYLELAFSEKPPGALGAWQLFATPLDLSAGSLQRQSTRAIERDVGTRSCQRRPGCPPDPPQTGPVAHDTRASPTH